MTPIINPISLTQKPKVGDKVKIKESYYKEELYGRIGIVTRNASSSSVYVEIDNTIYQVGFNDLELYTKPTEENKDNDMETKELNLCELLADHIGEYFYSPYLGECKLDEIKPDEDHNQIWLRTDNDVWVALPACGHEPDGFVMLFPSRALYEKYPLDPYTAWQKWAEEQKKPFICIHYGEVDCNGDEEEDYTGNTYFRTLSDRNKAIEEIKEVIKKHSLK